MRNATMAETLRETTRRFDAFRRNPYYIDYNGLYLYFISAYIGLYLYFIFAYIGLYRRLHRAYIGIPRRTHPPLLVLAGQYAVSFC